MLQHEWRGRAGAVGGPAAFRFHTWRITQSAAPRYSIPQPFVGQDREPATTPRLATSMNVMWPCPPSETREESTADRPAENPRGILPGLGPDDK